MPAPKIVQKLHDKPSFPTTYKIACRDHGKQVSAIMDRVAASKSETIKAAVNDPAGIKWQFVMARAKDPDDLETAEQIKDYFIKKSRVYLKATVGAPGSGGRSLQYEPLDTIPVSIMALFEQKASQLAKRRDQEDTDIDAEEEQGALMIGYRGDEDSLVSILDRWWTTHPQADKRLYYYVREGVKQLMESAGETSRRR